MADALELPHQDSYQAAFDQLRQRSPHNGQRWLRSLREQAMASFAERGWPTTKHEDWRFTNVRPITETPFVLAGPGQSRVSPDAIEPFLSDAGSGPLLVFVNGHYCPDLSRAQGLPRGVHATGLATALKDEADRVRPHLQRGADGHDDAFTDLNMALVEDGAFVHIEEGVDLADPIHLLFVSTAAAAPHMCHPRQLIVADANSRATVVENYVSLAEGVYWSNALTEVVVGPNAHLAHYRLERESEQAYNITTLRVRQQRDSRFESHTALFGAALVRNNVHVELVESGCDSLINGLFVGRSTQHMDNHMRVVHAAPHCDSRQFYKGILSESAHGIFDGRIVVKPGAQKTDAKQTNRNLLLSDEARINTKPQLEIYADDVKCTHGATTGQLDQDAIFYLRSRGLSHDAARVLLVYAFAAESLERMVAAPIRACLAQELARHFPQSAPFQPVVESSIEAATLTGVTS